MSIYYPNGIYNVLSYVGAGRTWKANDTTAAATNGAALQAALGAAQSTGGILLLPCVDSFNNPGTFYISGSITMDTSAASSPVIVLGYGGATTLHKTDATDLFTLSNQHPPTGLNLQGNTFANLTFVYDPIVGGGTAFNCTKATNLLLYRIYFSDCPNVAKMTDCLQFSMVQCTADYGSGYLNPGTSAVVQLLGTGGMSSGSEEATIEQCVFRAKFVSGNGPIYGIVIQEATHGHFTGTSINGLTVGVLMNPSALGGGADYHTFENVSINPGSGSSYAVKIQPAATIPNPAGFVKHTKFVACEFFASATGFPGVYIDVGGTGTINTVQFIGCSFDDFDGPAIWITSGAEITVSACTITGCAKAGVPQGQISVIGAANGVLVDGSVIDNGVQYGVDVESGAQNVFVRSCSIRANTLGAVKADSTIATLQVTDCAGYNDQGTQLASAIPTSGATFRNYTYGYYGPVEFYTAPQHATINSISLDGNNTFLTSGSFLLQPGEYAAISWSPIGAFVPSFVLIGK